MNASKALACLSSGDLDGCPKCAGSFKLHQNYCTWCGFQLRVVCVTCAGRLAVGGHTQCTDGDDAQRA